MLLFLGSPRVGSIGEMRVGADPRVCPVTKVQMSNRRAQRCNRAQRVQIPPCRIRSACPLGPRLAPVQLASRLLAFACVSAWAIVLCKGV